MSSKNGQFTVFEGQAVPAPDIIGKFIAFEGIDGAGKGRQIDMLTKYLDGRKRKYILTKEPTEGNIGRLLRQYLEMKLKGDDRSVAALFAADRLDHIFSENGILEQTNNGVTVISDRYYLSSYAYHSVGIDMEWVMAMNSEAAKAMKPAAHIFLDISADTAIERIGKRGKSLELFEKKERLERVRENYFIAMDKLKNTERFFVVNGEDTPENIHGKIIDFLESI